MAVLAVCGLSPRFAQETPPPPGWAVPGGDACTNFSWTRPGTGASLRRRMNLWVNLFSSNFAYLKKVCLNLCYRNFHSLMSMRKGFMPAKPSMVSWGAGPRTLHGNARGTPSMVGWGGVSSVYMPSVVTWTQPPLTSIYFFKRHVQACNVPGASKLSWNVDFYQVRHRLMSNLRCQTRVDDTMPQHRCLLRLPSGPSRHLPLLPKNFQSPTTAQPFSPTHSTTCTSYTAGRGTCPRGTARATLP